MSVFAPIKVRTSNGLEIVLRSPQPEDATDLLEAMETIVRESDNLITEPDEFNYTVEQEAGVIRSYLQREDRVFIVPVIEGKIAGALDFHSGEKRRNSHQGSLGLSVLPKYQRNGIGRAMVEAFIDWANRNPQLERVQVRIHGRNTASIKLFKSLGFVQEGHERRAIKLGDGVYDDVFTFTKSVQQFETAHRSNQVLAPTGAEIC